MKKIVFVFSIFFMGIIFLLSATDQNFIIVDGSKFTLELYNASGELLKTYPVGLGKNGMGKTKEGDFKTPLGSYEIIWKASRFAEVDGGYLIEDEKAFCGPDNVFTTDPEIGYMDEQLWMPAYGGDQAVVMCIDYPSLEDQQRGLSGGCIEIHASLLGGIGEYSSAGCVRLFPEDARELYNQVETGSKIFFKE